MAEHNPRPHEQAGTGAESIPPGATRKAWDRPTSPAGGTPGSGAGPRHMSGDPGDGNEYSETIDHHREGDPTLGDDPSISRDEMTEAEATAYSGISGGAVGGTPAGGRSSGGNIHHGLAPGSVHRGDSTIGADPDEGKGKTGKRSRKK